MTWAHFHRVAGRSNRFPDAFSNACLTLGWKSYSRSYGQKGTGLLKREYKRERMEEKEKENNKTVALLQASTRDGKKGNVYRKKVDSGTYISTEKQSRVNTQERQRKES